MMRLKFFKKNDLVRLFENNEKFRDEIKNFVKDKKPFGDEYILEERFRYNTLKNLGNKYLAKCILYKEFTGALIEISA